MSAPAWPRVTPFSVVLTPCRELELMATSGRDHLYCFGGVVIEHHAATLAEAEYIRVETIKPGKVAPFVLRLYNTGLGDRKVWHDESATSVRYYVLETLQGAPSPV